MIGLGCARVHTPACRTVTRGPTSTFATRDPLAKVDVGPRVTPKTRQTASGKTEILGTSL
jgi:hypothetical protein